MTLTQLFRREAYLEFVAAVINHFFYPSIYPSINLSIYLSLLSRLTHTVFCQVVSLAVRFFFFSPWTQHQSPNSQCDQPAHCVTSLSPLDASAQHQKCLK